jgi:hypothetical protein
MIAVATGFTMDLQRGPTCGLYALEAILKAYDNTVSATEKHRSSNIAQSTSGTSLRYIAKHNKPSMEDPDRPLDERGGCYTKIGELFYASEIPLLVDTIKPYLQNDVPNTAMVGQINQANFISAIKNEIDHDRLVMVPFTVKSDGTPYTALVPNHNAHWCVVWGYNDGSKKLLVSHWGRVWEFDADNLQKSNERIQDFPASEWGKKNLNGLNANIDYNQIDTDPLVRGTYKKIVSFPNVPLSCTLAKKIVVI